MLNDNTYQNAVLSTKVHRRLSEEGLLVYPVLSRRSGGISIGINLNPDRVCNFGCVYCQVNRVDPAPHPDIEMEAVLEQLSEVLEVVARSGGLWKGHPVKDIAFSGDGEPTTYPHFPQLLERVIALRDGLGLAELPLVMITNASRFQSDAILNCLPSFFNAGGRIWAKLDAGDEKSYQQIAQTKVPFQRILQNLLLVAVEHPIILQSCFMQLHEQPLDEAFLQRYIDTVQRLISQGAQIASIQAYTVARQPPESFVAPWDNATMDHITKLLHSQLQIPVEAYYAT